MTLDPCDPCACIPGYIGENEFFQKVLQAQCQILDLIGGGAEFTPPSDCTINLGTALKRFKDIYLCGNVILSAASAKIIPGSTSLLFRNNADSADNLTISDAGLVTLRNNSGANLQVPRLSILGTTVSTFTNIDAVFAAPRVYVPADVSTSANMALAARSSNTNGVQLEFFKTRSTTDWEGSTIVNNGDKIAALNFYGANGTGYSQAGAIIVTVDGTPGASNDMPGAIDFQVSPDGSATPASALKLTNDKKATFNGSIVLPTVGANLTPILSGASSLDADVTNIVSTHYGIGIVQDTTDFGDHGFFLGNGAVASGVQIQFLKTRGTGTDANTIVQSGDAIAKLFFRGADGAAYKNAAAIVVTVDATPGLNDMPGAIDFQTTPDGSTALASALKLSNDKTATFGGVIKTPSGSESTGAGSALLGTNSPAVTNTAPYKWLKFNTSDGSTVYVPAWK